MNSLPAKVKCFRCHHRGVVVVTTQHILAPFCAFFPLLLQLNSTLDIYKVRTNFRSKAVKKSPRNKVVKCVANAMSVCYISQPSRLSCRTTTFARWHSSFFEGESGELSDLISHQKPNTQLYHVHKWKTLASFYGICDIFDTFSFSSRRRTNERRLFDIISRFSAQTTAAARIFFRNFHFPSFCHQFVSWLLFGF